MHAFISLRIDICGGMLVYLLIWYVANILCCMGANGCVGSPGECEAEAAHITCMHIVIINLCGIQI